MLGDLEQLRTAAIRCADTPLWSLTDDDVIACIDTLHAATQALAAAQLHLLRQVETRDITRNHLARSSGAWLRDRLLIRTRTGRQLTELATAVDQHPDLDQALTAGAVNTEQAHVITRCLRDLPADIGIEAHAKAETVLITWAAQLDPDQLRIAGKRILDHVAPDIAEAREAAALAREEADAHAARFFNLRDAGDGRVRLTGILDTEAAAVLNAALDPLCAPHCTADTLRPASLAGVFGDATGAARDLPRADDRTSGQRRADALVEICRLTLATGDLPANGGDRPQVTVTVPYDLLRNQLGHGTLDTGERLTPEQARRLACDAQIIPAVLGGDRQVLDLGRSRRLITGALRRALVLRDRGCAFPGCNLPPRWTDGHHIKSWVDGGPTNLDNSVLLCRQHHRTIHHTDWQVRLGPDKLPEFLPPSNLDPTRRPRRNIYHRRT
ncbi:MAG TPA: DUF222 domain-containing protein [Actinoplanes sp.]|nr:DUF222 domain-containing protein [Actinoplanes sp.]